MPARAQEAISALSSRLAAGRAEIDRRERRERGARKFEDDMETDRREVLEKIIEPFEAEQTDRAWAGPAEESLTAEFEAYSGGAHLADVILESVECRTTRCQILLHYTGSDGPVRSAMEDALFGRDVFRLPGCVLHSTGIEEGAQGAVQSLYAHCPR